MVDASQFVYNAKTPSSVQAVKFGAKNFLAFLAEYRLKAFSGKGDHYVKVLRCTDTGSVYGTEYIVRSGCWLVLTEVGLLTVMSDENFKTHYKPSKTVPAAQREAYYGDDPIPEETEEKFDHFTIVFAPTHDRTTLMVVRRSAADREGLRFASRDSFRYEDRAKKYAEELARKNNIAVYWQAELDRFAYCLD